MSLSVACRPLVNFLVVGAQKSATTAIGSCLRQHPEICMANRSEVHFFDDEELFGSSSVDYGVYHSFFRPGAMHKAVGEVTPIYMYWFDSAKRIWSYNADMKIIFSLRNPIDRAYSHWNMERNRGKEVRSFREAIDGEEAACRVSLPLQNRVHSYVSRGYYSEQIRRLLTYFPPSQLMAIKFEEWIDSPVTCFRNICSFLDVSPCDGIPRHEARAGEYSEPMASCDRQHLHSFYEFEIRQTERMLGWDCSDWLSL